MHEYKKALNKLSFMIDSIPRKYLGQLWLLRGLINVSLGNISDSKRDFNLAKKHDPENASKYLD
jgi:hypothetical protein